MRLRITEIGERAVAHVLGHKAAGALDHLRAAALIGADDLAHVLGVEPRRQWRRADEVAEQHCQLPPLGIRLTLRCTWRSRGRRGARLGIAQRRNSFEQPFAVPHRHAELLEVGVGQLGQYLMVDLVLAEYWLVLLEA
jgi:hypothetical protein